MLDGKRDRGGVAVWLGDIVIRGKKEREIGEGRAM
jgi:hypothetical protein